MAPRGRTALSPDATRGFTDVRETTRAARSHTLRISTKRRLEASGHIQRDMARVFDVHQPTVCQA